MRLGDRTLWTWRDTQSIHPNTGEIQQRPVLPSTASWSDRNEDDSLAFEHDILRTSDRPGMASHGKLVLKHYGENNIEKAYFRIIHNGREPRAGIHKDGTRRSTWPDSPLLVASSSTSGRVIAYAWVRKTHIRDDGSVVARYPATTMYRLSYVPSKDKNVLPYASVVDGSFWNENEVPSVRMGMTSETESHISSLSLKTT